MFSKNKVPIIIKNILEQKYKSLNVLIISILDVYPVEQQFNITSQELFRVNSRSI